MFSGKLSGLLDADAAHDDQVFPTGTRFRTPIRAPQQGGPPHGRTRHRLLPSLDPGPEPATTARRAQRHGYDLLFEEKISSRLRGDRPQFAAALAELEAGDTLLFWKSDRWGRTAAHVLTVVIELRDRDVKVISLTENFDLDTKEGRFMFAVLAAAAEYELELRAERQGDGIAAAKRRQADGQMLPGKEKMGRPPASWARRTRPAPRHRRPRNLGRRSRPAVEDLPVPPPTRHSQNADQPLPQPAARFCRIPVAPHDDLPIRVAREDQLRAGGVSSTIGLSAGLPGARSERPGLIANAPGARSELPTLSVELRRIFSQVCGLRQICPGNCRWGPVGSNTTAKPVLVLEEASRLCVYPASLPPRLPRL